MTRRLNIALRLLDWASRHGAREEQEWALAVRSEMAYVEGKAEQDRWALGAAVFLVLRVLYRAPRSRLAKLSASELSKSRVVLFAGLGFLTISLLFLASPVFRQGLRDSALSWRLNLSPAVLPEDTLADILQRARRDKYPTGIAFAAIHLPLGAEASAAAEEAVLLDESLTWIYAVTASRNMPNAKANAKAKTWLARLQTWDPDNAFPKLLEADRLFYEMRASNSGKSTTDIVAKPAWRVTVEQAFQCRKYDSYGDRERELDSSIARRYRGLNEFVLLAREGASKLRALESLSLYIGPRSAAGQELPFVIPGTRTEAAQRYQSVLDLVARIRMVDRTEVTTVSALAIERRARAKLTSLQSGTDSASLVPAAADFLTAYWGWQENRYFLSQRAVRRALAASNSRRQAALFAMVLSIMALAVCIVARWLLPGSRNLRALLSLGALLSCVVVCCSCILLYEASRRFTSISASLPDLESRRLAPLMGGMAAEIHQAWSIGMLPTLLSIVLVGLGWLAVVHYVSRAFGYRRR